MNAWEGKEGNDAVKMFFKMRNALDDIAKVMKDNTTVVVLENGDGEQVFVSLDSKEKLERLDAFRENGYKYKGTFNAPAK